MDRLADPEYKNWIKVGLGLQCVKDGISKFSKTVSEELHKELLNQIKNKKKCSSCHERDLEYKQQSWQFKKPCPDQFCDSLLQCIQQQHKNKKSARKQINIKNNSSVSKWGTDSWEVAKIYMGKIKKNQIQDSESTDTSNILIFLDNCDFCNQTFLKNKNVLNKVTNVRNTVMHSATYKVTDQKLIDNLEIMITLLTDEAKLKHDYDAQKAVDALEKMKDLNFEIEWKQKEVDVVKVNMSELESSLAVIEPDEVDNHIELIKSANNFVEFIEDENNKDIKSALYSEEYESLKKETRNLYGKLVEIEVITKRIDKKVSSLLADKMDPEFNHGYDYMDELNRLVQKNPLLEMKWKPFKEPNDQNWKMELCLGDKTYKSKSSYHITKVAKQDAAHQALKDLKSTGASSPQRAITEKINVNGANKAVADVASQKLENAGL